jgi:hypothetical protein
MKINPSLKKSKRQFGTNMSLVSYGKWLGKMHCVYIGRLKLSIDIKRRFRGLFLIAENAVATN